MSQDRDEILRLAVSIKTGIVTVSLMMRKLGAYPSQNGLTPALREACWPYFTAPRRWLVTSAHQQECGEVAGPRA